MKLDYAWLGQPLALDLANTVVLVEPESYFDMLQTKEDVRRWLDLEMERLGNPDLGVLRNQRLRALRTAIRTLFLAAAAHRPMSRRATDILNHYSARLQHVDRLRVGTEGPVAERVSIATNNSDRVLGQIAASAIGVLGTDERARLSVCEGPGCGLFFLATRPAQVWCCGGCGNRARVARHYERQKKRIARVTRAKLSPSRASRARVTSSTQRDST